MITRRQFISLSATAAAAISVNAYPQVPGQPAQSGSKKKGLGLGVKTPDWAGRLSNLHCKWCYTWMGSVPPELPQGMEFIPMIRSRYANAQKIAEVVQQATGYGIPELLGFNEPDAKKQDDMTVKDALDAWPLLMETGLRLGSPACVHPDKDWMVEFMAGVEERKLRVDFVCVHSYGKPNPEALVSRLQNVYKMFKRPIWITEFAVGDWQAKSLEEHEHSPQDVLRFMEKVLPRLDNLDFLERYAWYPAGPDSIPLGTSALFDTEGALTPLGECYRDA